jgi:pyruvate, orthophosphate dikinase
LCGRILGFDFPQDPTEQLRLATEAVFKSWNGKRAVDYRNAAGIAHDLGTAVNIQTMVFGNMGWESGTGVAFTRDPADGERKLYGDYLLNAQGEDVVAGIRNTKPRSRSWNNDLPEAYQEFMEICPPGKALPRYAGCGIHHRARQAVDAADPLRQAHRQG